MVTLSQQLKLLADGFRKRYGKTETLTLADMTKLVTPPPIASGTDLLGGVPFVRADDSDMKPFKFEVKTVPPAMTVPIKLAVSLFDNMGLIASDLYIIINLSGGKQLTLKENGSADSGNRNQKNYYFTIPANTHIANNAFTLGSSENTLWVKSVKSIIATYVGGVINRLLSAFTSLIGGEAA